MSETQAHKPTGYTAEMRAARAAQMAAPNDGLPSALGPNAAPADDAEVVHAITRENRRPFGATTQKLAYPERTGYHRHWFNDEPGRILGAEEAGYAHVKHDKGPKRGTNVETVVGRREGGHPQVAFLMEIPQEWYDDDMRAYEERASAVENAIRKGAVEGKVGPQEANTKFYPAAQGRQISLTRSSR